jgi:hypothetical protein
MDDNGVYAQNVHLDGTLGNTTGVQSFGDERPQQFALFQNYPNPFNPTTTISWKIPESRFVTLRVYDLLGCEVATLVNEVMPPGEYQIPWDARQNLPATGLPSGLYFYRLVAGGYSETKRALLLK